MTRTSAKQQPDRTILLVEDDFAILKYLKKQLKRKGYTVLAAENGLVAWDLFLLESPALIVTDIFMPELNGLELLKRVLHISPEFPVVIMSGAGTMDDVISAMRLGAWDYLTKPIESPDILFYTINKAFEWTRLKRLSLDYQEMLEAKVLEKTTELQDELNTRKATEKSLDHARRQWEQTFNAIPDLIALVDINNKIVRANKAMANALGVDPSETFGMDISLLFEDNWPMSYEFSADNSVAKQQHTEIFDKKTNCYFELSIIPYLDPESSQRIGSIHIARDIHSRKEAEKEKERMHLQYLHAQKLESVGQLAAGIAHEINTPIQYVATNMEFIRQAFTDLEKVINSFSIHLTKAENSPLPPEIVQKMRQALDDADWEYLKKEIPDSIDQSRDGLGRVSSIVRAMKEFSHPGSKEKEQVDISHLIETTIIVAKNEWKYVAEVVTEFDKDLPLVLCIAEEIGQVILNLLINASHAIEDRLGQNPKGHKGTITIKTRKNDDVAEIYVTDTGTGIPNKILNRIFDPFFTTKKVGKGTGQGLAITHNVICEKHHGSIEIESTIDVGTTFILHLPISN